MASRQETDRLERYRRKRRASTTPEPFGAVPDATAPSPPETGRFVVQKHAARRLQLGGDPGVELLPDAGHAEHDGGLDLLEVVEDLVDRLGEADRQAAGRRRPSRR